ncbi:hypothetical protein CDAR_395821 [Caerostris darwini]|uniref:Uncharacterized protein n=1 Tax=Caerostris darwini TaxID=1538125 RepID=A0AAV4QLT5_9ARAC|nr:hypothetical protein CDAR_395821 [Caerostris darwini]
MLPPDGGLVPPPSFGEWVGSRSPGEPGEVFREGASSHGPPPWRMIYRYMYYMKFGQENTKGKTHLLLDYKPVTPSIDNGASNLSLLAFGF